MKFIIIFHLPGEMKPIEGLELLDRVRNKLGHRIEASQVSSASMKTEKPYQVINGNQVYLEIGEDLARSIGLFQKRTTLNLHLNEERFLSLAEESVILKRSEDPDRDDKYIARFFLRAETLDEFILSLRTDKELLKEVMPVLDTLRQCPTAFADSFNSANRIFDEP